MVHKTLGYSISESITVGHLIKGTVNKKYLKKKDESIEIRLGSRDRSNKLCLFRIFSNSWLHFWRIVSTVAVTQSVPAEAAHVSVLFTSTYPLCLTLHKGADTCPTLEHCSLPVPIVLGNIVGVKWVQRHGQWLVMSNGRQGERWRAIFQRVKRHLLEFTGWPLDAAVHEKYSKFLILH